MMRIACVLLVLLSVLTFPRPSESADVTSLVKGWETTWTRTQDFTSRVTTHITKGDAAESRTLDLWFKRPVNIRTEVLSGNRAHDPGSVAVYRGEGTVTGHQGGLLSGINLTLRIDDERCTSIRGGVITDLIFSRPLEVIHQYQRRRCNLALGAPLTVAGRSVVPLTLTTTNNNFIALNDNVNKDVLYYDQQQQVPVRWERYEPNGQRVIEVTWTDTHLNAGVEDRLFDPRARSR